MKQIKATDKRKELTDTGSKHKEPFIRFEDRRLEKKISYPPSDFILAHSADDEKWVLDRTASILGRLIWGVPLVIVIQLSQVF